jgi:hypothetical protein
MTFSKEQQRLARKLFTKECSQKLGAACNADFVSKQHDKLTGYKKMKKEDDQRSRRQQRTRRRFAYPTKERRCAQGLRCGLLIRYLAASDSRHRKFAKARSHP